MGQLASLLRKCCCCKNTTILKYILLGIIYGIPVLILLIFGLLMLIVGAVNINECVYQQMVPVWMIVGGILPLPLLFFLIMSLRDKTEKLVTVWKITTLVILVIFVAWLIAGSVWVISTWTYANEGCSDSDCCATILMRVSLVGLLAHWCFFGLATVIVIYVIIFVVCIDKSGNTTWG